MTKKGDGQCFPVTLLLSTSIHYCRGLEGADGVLKWLKVLRPEEKESSGQGGAYTWYTNFTQEVNYCVGSRGGRNQNRGSKLGGKNYNRLNLLSAVNLLLEAGSLMRCMSWDKTILKVKVQENWLIKQFKPGAMWKKNYFKSVKRSAERSCCVGNICPDKH